MADKKTKEKTTRRTEADKRARDKANVESLIAMFGPKGDGKKNTGTKKK